MGSDNTLVTPLNQQGYS